MSTIWHPFFNSRDDDENLSVFVTCPKCGTSIEKILLLPGHGFTTSSSTCGPATSTEK